ncbi:hypothetical protein JVU11DRAFT_9139 [Chiua virens]|nr:hypothetical protein JVU11DRAFT_9139 [Chiua virens]
MAAIAPFLSEAMVLQDINVPSDAVVNTDDDLEDLSILGDINGVAKLISVLQRSQANEVESSMRDSKHGVDLVVRTGDKVEVTAHHVVLAARCTPLCDALGGNETARDESFKYSVTFVPSTIERFGVSIARFSAPLSLLILLHYVYTDDVLAVWDHRVESFFEAHFSSLGISTTQVKADLTILARLLHLPHLTSALQSVGKRDVKLSAGSDFRWLFDQAQLSGSLRRNVGQDPIAPDVALHLADKTVYTHSTVLRARSAFFSAFFSIRTGPLNGGTT